MKKTILTLFVFSCLSIVAKAQNTWLKTFGCDKVEKIFQVETDDENSVYVAGRINADLKVADTVVKKTGSSTTYNYFLLKFDKEGQFVWVTTFVVGQSYDNITDIAIDKDHNVYVSLYEPSYYYKFNSKGIMLFEKRINAFNAKMGGIAIDDEGNTWVGCSVYDRTVKIDNLPLLDPGDNKAIMFLVKLDSSGLGKQIIPFASNSFTSQIAGIHVKDSFVYAIGNTDGDIVVGTDTFINCEMITAKFNTSGEYKWAKPIMGTEPLGFEHITDIAVSDNHQVVITGRYDDPIFVKNVTLPNPAERERMFLISYDKDGDLLWARNSTSYYTSGIEIQFTPDNTLAYIANYAFNFLYQGTGVGDGVSGKRYPILMEVDTMGQPLWAYTLGQSDWTYINGLAVDTEGNWYVGGDFTAKPTTVLDGKTITATNDGDLYLLKNFTVPKPTAQNKTFCGGAPTKELTATGVGLRWYTDSTLTSLVHQGDKLQVNATQTTTYYVVQKAGGAISQPLQVTATILPATQVSLQTTFPAITALPKTAKKYRWYADGVEMTGETSHTIIPTKSAKYHAVLVDTNDCDNYSDTINYTYTSVKELEDAISIYPNPASQQVEIKGLPTDDIENASIYTLDGKLIKQVAIRNNTIQTADIKNGVYLLSLQTATHRFMKKLVISH